MRKQTYLFILLSLFTLSSFSWADDAQTITLKDGSQIKGNLVGITNGTYTVHTPTLGDVKVSTSQVSSITTGAPMPVSPNAPAASSNNDFNQKIQSAQNKLMNDPEMMQQVTAMAQDPELMKLLSDPELTQAVMSHDVNAIQSNPKAQALMNNPRMKALMEELRSKTSQ